LLEYILGLARENQHYDDHTASETEGSSSGKVYYSQSREECGWSGQEHEWSGDNWRSSSRRAEVGADTVDTNDTDKEGEAPADESDDGPTVIYKPWEPKDIEVGDVEAPLDPNAFERAKAGEKERRHKRNKRILISVAILVFFIIVFESVVTVWALLLLKGGGSTTTEVRQNFLPRPWNAWCFAWLLSNDAIYDFSFVSLHPAPFG
jgi:hypothetical protein